MSGPMTWTQGKETFTHWKLWDTVILVERFLPFFLEL